MWYINSRLHISILVLYRCEITRDFAAEIDTLIPVLILTSEGVFGPPLLVVP